MLATITPAHQYVSQEVIDWSPHILSYNMIFGRLDLSTTSYSGLGSLRDRGHMCEAGDLITSRSTFVVSPDICPSRLLNVQTDVQMAGYLFGLFSASRA